MDTRAVLVLFGLISCAKSTDFPTLNHLVPSASVGDQAETVTGLIQRLIPQRAAEFIVTIDTSIGPANRDTFKLLKTGDKIHVTGTTGVAAGWGFYHYLSEYAGCHVSWAGAQINLPQTLPDLPPEGVTVTSNDRFRYYQNVCTVSYSFAWWNWTRWEKELDWMVMNGYNLALAFQGQEEIWQRVYSKLGFTQAEIDEHLGGPAFLSWSRMGNMRGWGGPITASWHSQQVALQHRILDRMRSFGITPVTPAFAGHVPRSFNRIFPNSSVSRAGDWGGFNATYCCVSLLDFHDPAFTQMGKAFLSEYIKEFGTNHVYNADTFNELNPKSSEPSYISSAGKAVFSSLLAGDPKAIWLMQGWLFAHDPNFWQPAQAKALVTSVPIGKMIVLDLWSEVRPEYKRLHSYYGQPYIWCMLHNFGGAISMYGVIDIINKEPFKARAMSGSSMIGTGLTPEGINQNEAIYAFMNENSWRKHPRNLTEWMENYTTRRYGQANKFANLAWQILKGSVYNATGSEMSVGIVTKLPQLTDPITIDIWFDPADLYLAWDHMLSASTALNNSDLYRYDLVDVTRESLVVLSTLYYNNIIVAYKNKDLDSIKKWGDGLVGLLADLDELLGTDKHFLLGRWLADAKALATDDAERERYEFNARKQITVWGTNTMQLVDYAAKQWSGLVKSYYLGRWKLFVDSLTASLESKKPFDEKQFQQDVYCKVENPFTEDRSIFPNEPEGDQIGVAQKIHTKYRHVTRRYASYFTHLKKTTSSSTPDEFSLLTERYENRVRRTNLNNCPKSHKKVKQSERANFIIKSSPRSIL